MKYKAAALSKLTNAQGVRSARQAHAVALHESLVTVPNATALGIKAAVAHDFETWCLLPPGVVHLSGLVTGFYEFDISAWQYVNEIQDTYEDRVASSFVVVLIYMGMDIPESLTQPREANHNLPLVSQACTASCQQCYGLPEE